MKVILRFSVCVLRDPIPKNWLKRAVCTPPGLHEGYVASWPFEAGRWKEIKGNIAINKIIEFRCNIFVVFSVCLELAGKGWCKAFKTQCQQLLKLRIKYHSTSVENSSEIMKGRWNLERNYPKPYQKQALPRLSQPLSYLPHPPQQQTTDRHSRQTQQHTFDDSSQR